MKRMKIYQAGPLFSEAERAWHRECRSLLREKGHEVIWPFELFPQEEISSWGDDAALRIMTGCRDAVDACDVVVALLDGPQVDDGTAWEIGYAHARGIPVYGIRTDFRAGGDTPGSKVNAMIEGSCEAIARGPEELVLHLEKTDGKKVRGRILP